MNEATKRPRRRILALAAALAVAACSGGDPAAAPPLEGASMANAFTLTSHEGRRLSGDDLRGKYRLVYFGYTFCPDICPVDLQTLSAGLNRFEESDPARAAKVQPLFITADPARDTPEVLREYVSAFHPRLIGLTGSAEEVATAAREHGVFYSRAGPEGARDYLVTHAQMIVLYGPQGEPIAIVPHDQGPQGVAGELEKWVR